MSSGLGRGQFRTECGLGCGSALTPTFPSLCARPFPKALYVASLMLSPPQSPFVPILQPQVHVEAQRIEVGEGSPQQAT